jgi:hypothetical protein
MPHVGYVKHWNDLLLHGLTHDGVLRCAVVVT